MWWFGACVPHGGDSYHGHRRLPQAASGQHLGFAVGCFPGGSVTQEIMSLTRPTLPLFVFALWWGWGRLPAGPRTRAFGSTAAPRTVPSTPASARWRRCPAARRWSTRRATASAALRRRVRSRLLRRRGLLQQRLQRHLPEVRRPRQRRHVRPGAGRHAAGAGEPVSEAGCLDLRPGRPVRRHGRLPQVPGQHVLRGRHLPGQHGGRGQGLHGRHLHGRRHHGLRALQLQPGHRPLLRRLRQQQPV